MKSRFWNRSFFSIVANALLTLAFLVFLISQIVNPSQLGKIGIDPTSGHRWMPTLVDKVIGYSALSLGSIFGILCTLGSIDSYAEKRRRKLKRGRP